MWVGINVWWYLGDHIIDVVRPCDTVCAVGFRLHAESILYDAKDIVKYTSTEFYADDYNISM